MTMFPTETDKRKKKKKRRNRRDGKTQNSKTQKHQEKKCSPSSSPTSWTVGRLPARAATPTCHPSLSSCIGYRCLHFNRNKLQHRLWPRGIQLFGSHHTLYENGKKKMPSEIARCPAAAAFPRGNKVRNKSVPYHTMPYRIIRYHTIPYRTLSTCTVLQPAGGGSTEEKNGRNSRYFSTPAQSD